MNKQKGTIMLMVMLMFIGFGIVIPVLPHVVTDELGFADFHVQVMLAVYSLASFIVSPLWGALSERIGRKPVMMTGMIGFSVSFLVFGLAVSLQSDGVIGSDFSLLLMYVSRTLSGLFSGATIAVSMAYMADITSDEERTKGMGLIGMSIGLGFIFGPAVGGLLTIGGSYALPFFVSAGLSFLTMLAAAMYVKESLTATAREKALAERANSSSRWTAFRGSSRYLFVLAFLATFILAGLEGTLQLFQMEKIGVTPAQMGMMFLLSGIAGALMQGGFIQRYVKKGDEVRYMIIGFILSGIAFVLLLFSQTLVDASIYLCLFGIGNSLIRPCVTSLITQKATVGHGLSTGLSASFDSLGRVLGPLFAGVMFGFDISLPFIIGAVLSVLAVTVVMMYVKADKVQIQNG
jgi:DHA1 family multidrug resistance protein-like MFS transporter